MQGPLGSDSLVGRGGSTGSGFQAQSCVVHGQSKRLLSSRVRYWLQDSGPRVIGLRPSITTLQQPNTEHLQQGDTLYLTSRFRGSGRLLSSRAQGLGYRLRELGYGVQIGVQGLG